MAEQQQSGMFRTVMNIFSPPKAVGTPAANTTVPSDQTPISDGKGPKAIPAVGDGDKSPLDGYSKLWEHADTDGKPLSLVPSMDADPTKLLAAAKTVDFTKAMNPELLDKASKGDAGALGALVNEAAQAGYAQSALATTKIVEAALKKQAENFTSTIMPELLRRNNIGRDLRTDNPLFDNPAVKPMLEGLERQLAIKYKDATPAEITQHAKTVLTGFAEEYIKSSGKTISDASASEDVELLRNIQPAKDFDWEQHFLGKRQK